MDIDKFNRYLNFAQNTVYSEPETPQFHTPLIKLAIDNFFDKLNLPHDALIYDIGCGQGTFMDMVKERGYQNLVGITLSIEDSEACINKGYEVMCADMSDFDTKDSEVDLIWCRHALEHSVFPFFTLLEFNRVLKMGGKLYVEVPAPDLERRHEFNNNHFSVMGTVMWQALFQRTGFSIDLSHEINLQLQLPEQKETPEKFFCYVLTKQHEPSYS